MANTTPLSYRIDTELKIEAEKVLNSLGLTPTAAIQIFYKQVILYQGIPFELKLKQPSPPLSLGSMSKEMFNHELQQGIDSIENGEKYTADEVENKLTEEFNL